jgi:hypothetical protein
LGRRPDEHPWSTGAEGEELVGRYLATLGPDWYTLHAVPVGDRGSDIDHVVIGPAGVFTVNDKNHPKAAVWVRGNTVKVNGFNGQYVRNSRFEAARAANLLTATAGFDVTVLGVVAFVGPELRLTVKEQPSDGCVVVIGGEDLVDYLHNLPAVLGTPSVERIYSRARHLATWQPAVAWSDFE